MLTPDIKSILDKSRQQGWVMEPQAKQILRQSGFDVPDSVCAQTLEEARAFAANKGFPVVAKGVSPQIIHKTEHGAVITAISDSASLEQAFQRLMKLPGAEGVLVESMVTGTELIVGAKNDYQFGPVVLLGTGGVGVELYGDVAIRMAPVKETDVMSMVASLKGRALFDGFRGRPGINMELLSDLVVRFSRLAMDMETHVASMDLNPVICNMERCCIADARIIF